MNSLLGGLPDAAPLYYIHDLALLPSMRGQGAGPVIVERLAQHCAVWKFGTMALVAVNGSAPFWERQGFIADNAAFAEKLQTYGGQAMYMTKTVQPVAQ